MAYLRTKLATDFAPSSPAAGTGILSKVLSLVPIANPDYEPKLHLVREWLIEFDDDGRPNREVGLDSHGFPIVSGPDDRNYGFWPDTNMLLNDFAGDPIEKALFEAVWKQAHSKGGGIGA